jgi:HEAT repeat protein
MTGLHTWLLMVLLAGPDGAGRVAGPAAPAAEVPDLARLQELLYHRQPQGQSQAAFLLVQSQQPEAVETVRKGLQRWDRPDVFQALAAAIRLARDHRHEAALLKALGSEQGLIRQAAIEALPRLESATLVRTLLALAGDQSAALTARQAAVAVLGACVQKAAAVALLTLLSNDSPAVRQASAAALESLSGRNLGASALPWQEWWQQYKDVSEEQWLVNRTALLADRTRSLQDELDRAENQIVQLHKDLFLKVPPAERSSHLAALIQNEYPSVRSLAVTWLVESLAGAEPAEQKKLAELLIKLSDDGMEKVQQQAVLAMEKVGDPRVFERLLLLLETASPNVRAAAARSLGRYRPGTSESATLNLRAIGALEKALGDGELLVVVEAAASLGTMDAPEAAPVLARLLKHPADRVRQAAAEALEQVTNANILADLHEGLYDPVASVRLSLVGALGNVAAGGKLKENEVAGVVKRLTDVLLRDSDPGVRSRAAAVIGKIGSPGDLPVLWERVRATEDNRVQLKAWTAFLDILFRWQSWTLLLQWDQQLAAKDPLRRIEMLTVVRQRWLKLETVKQHLDPLTSLLIEAQLQQKKWQAALPLALELVRKDADDAEMQKRLRWFLVIGDMALLDKKSQAVLDMLKQMEDLLPRARELAPDFDALRQRALKSPG